MINMTLTQENFERLFGWILGILSIIIAPFLVVPIRKWQDRRSFEKIAKEDIRFKISHLKSKNEEITLFFGNKPLNSIRIDLAYKTITAPVIYDNLSNDFFYTNYKNFLEYFNNNTNLLGFYKSIDRLINFKSLLEDITDKNSVEYKNIFLDYWNHLQNIITDGEKISI